MFWRKGESRTSYSTIFLMSFSLVVMYLGNLDKLLTQILLSTLFLNPSF